MGISTSKNKRASPSSARGKVESKEEAIALLRLTLQELPKEGKEAFFRYLRGDKYPEDKDICDIDFNADGMTEMPRKYQFWLQCEQVEHYKRLFQDCVLNDEDRFPEVIQCFNKPKKDDDEDKPDNFADFLKTKQKSIDSSQSFATELKGMIQDQLNKKYEKFQSELRERFKD